MKKKAMVLALSLAIAFSVAFVPGKALALTQGWHFGTVDYAGPLFGKIIIRVDITDGASDQWLELNPAMQNQLLATALTALSTGEQVRIWVSDDPHNLAGITVQTCFSVLLITE